MPAPAQRMDFPITLKLYQQLCTAACESPGFPEVWEVGCVAIRDWLSRNHPEVFPNHMKAGFQWKELFLPHGTILRTSFQGITRHCVVEKDKIIDQGHATTPSRFANAEGGVRRNAWRCVWLLLPDASCWRSAASLRGARPKRACP